MLVPGARFDDAPPPLPPPRYNEELAQGVDVAWSWANSDPFHSVRRLAPIKPGSSLNGGYLESRRISGRSREVDDMDLEDNYPRRGSNVSTVRSPSQSAIHLGAQVPHLISKPPSPTLANQRSVSHGILYNGSIFFGCLGQAGQNCVWVDGRTRSCAVPLLEFVGALLPPRLPPSLAPEECADDRFLF